MPQKWWKHRCLHDEMTYGAGHPNTCSYCGEKYEYNGWGRTSSEAKAWYQKKYGVKIIGPHRKYLHEIFSGTDRSCSDCDGTGYHDIDLGRDYEVCSTCQGSGRVWLISKGRIRKLREIVLQKYPDEAAPWDILSPEDNVILQDLENSEMLVFK